MVRWSRQVEREAKQHFSEKLCFHRHQPHIRRILKQASYKSSKSRERGAKRTGNGEGDRMTLLRGRPSLQVASTSYQSPVHLYRRILRLANNLARTWDDETIYHAQRYLAQRNVKKWGEAAAADRKGSSSSRGVGESRAAEPQGGEASSLSPSTAIQAAQYRPFMRLKSHLSLLQRAHRGGRDEMVKALDWTYARRGVLRWAGLRPFLSKAASPEEGPAYAVTSITKEGKGNAGKLGTAYAPSPALISLLSSPLITHSPSSNGDSSSSSSLPTFTLPLPREGATGGHPFHKLANKQRNSAAKVIKRKLGRVRVPLGEEVVRGVEGRVRGDTERLRLVGQQEDAASSSKGKARSASSLQQRGPLHPESEHFARQKRRVWAALLSRIPILPMPKGAEGEPAGQHEEEEQGRTDVLSPSSRSKARLRRSLYLSPSRLPTASIPGLVEAWNRRLSLASSSSPAEPPPSPGRNEDVTAGLVARRRSPFFIPFNLSPLSLFRTNEKRPPSVPALASQARVAALLEADEEEEAAAGTISKRRSGRGGGGGNGARAGAGQGRMRMGSEEEERWVRMT